MKTTSTKSGGTPTYLQFVSRFDLDLYIKSQERKVNQKLFGLFKKVTFLRLAFFLEFFFVQNAPESPKMVVDTCFIVQKIRLALEHPKRTTLRSVGGCTAVNRPKTVFALLQMAFLLSWMFLDSLFLKTTYLNPCSIILTTFKQP